MSVKPSSTTARGYGRKHQQQRAALQPAVDAGLAYCMEPLCLMPSRWIAPGSTWDLAHGETRNEYRGTAHSRCNRAEGAKRGNRRRRSRKLVQTRRWAL